MNRTDFLTYNGRTQTVSGWANELNISIKRFMYRVRRDGIEGAMNTRKRGRKSTVMLLEHNGETKTIREWAGDVGITPQALRFRMEKYPVATALVPKLPKPELSPEHAYDRQRNKAHWYGEPERLANGKYYRTEHLEKYIRSAWAA